MKFLRQARMGVKFTQSLIAYHLKTAPRPFSAAFALTDRCNLHCSYCNFPSLAGKELDTIEVFSLFERLYTLGVRRLGIFGGEPMIRKDLPEIIAMAKRCGFFVTINSNLNLYAARPQTLDQADLILTSLDGDEEEHEKNRGKGSYNGIIDAITDLRQKKKTVVAIKVVRDGNLEQAESLLDQAQQLGIKIHFQPQCLDAVITRGMLPEESQTEDLRDFWRGILDLKKTRAPVACSVAYLREQILWSDYRVSSFKDPDTRCAAGRGFMFLDPLGNAWPCAFTRGTGGAINLLEENWSQAWTGETACTRCNVGPMLEFNLLFRQPLLSTINAFRVYRWISG